MNFCLPFLPHSVCATTPLIVVVFVESTTGSVDLWRMVHIQAGLLTIHGSGTIVCTEAGVFITVNIYIYRDRPTLTDCCISAPQQRDHSISSGSCDRLSAFADLNCFSSNETKGFAHSERAATKRFYIGPKFQFDRPCNVLVFTDDGDQ